MTAASTGVTMLEICCAERATFTRVEMATALELGTRDARLFYHAGMIERALGERATAARYLRQALATNPYFHPRYAADAKRALEALDAERGQGETVPNAR